MKHGDAASEPPERVAKLTDLLGEVLVAKAETDEPRAETDEPRVRWTKTRRSTAEGRKKVSCLRGHCVRVRDWLVCELDQD